MALRLLPLDETTRPAFERLLEHVWELDLSPVLMREVIRWRFHDRPPNGSTWLALDDDRCVAAIDSFVRTYLLEGRPIRVRETCDWFCMPEYRVLGLGLQIMRRMMACPEPILSVGGTEATLSILPRLGWKPLPEVQKYVLPARARGLAGSMLRRKWPAHEALARAIPGFVPLRPLRPVPAPPGGTARVSEWRPGTATPLPLPDPQGCVQILEPADGEWIARAPPEFVRPFGLLFFLSERPVGFSLAQLEPVASGLDGSILHLQIAHDAQPVTDWIVAETARRLIMRGAGIVRCGASSPEKAAALERAGFVARKPEPGYWWSRAGIPPPVRIDVGYLRANDGMPFDALRGRRLGTAGRNPVLSGSVAAGARR